MKKTTLAEFRAWMQERTEFCYRLAYAVKGNKKDAEALTEETLIYGAKKYGGLAKKERVLDIMAEKIGKGDFTGFEEADYEAILNRAMDKIMVQDKKKRIFASIGTSVAILAIICGVILHTLLSGNQDYGVLTMKNTDIVSGDSGILSLVNYHNISDTIGKKGSYEVLTDNCFLLRIADSVIAPNEKTYMVYQNLEKEDGSNTTFSLYEMGKSEWHELGKGETSAEYKEVTETMHTYATAMLYLIADENSNLYVFTILNGVVVVYKYDQETENFDKLQAEYPAEDLGFLLHYDREYGEKGTVYIGFTDYIRVEVAYFDIAKESFACFCKPLYPNVAICNFNIYAQNHIIYLLADGFADYRQLNYCAISEGGEFITKPIKLNSSYDPINGQEHIYPNSHGGGIIISEDGTVHAIVTRYSFRDKEENRLIHYAISTDGTVKRDVLNPLFFEGSEYYPLGICMFADGNDIYFIEHYEDVKDFFAIGKITSDGTVSCLESFTLFESIEFYGMRVHGHSVIFRSGEDIWHFAFASKKE